MARWSPDPRGRLREAAIELYARDGFAQTTARAIAERAGLTERTFFRHFADKREVLFGGEEELRTVLADAIAAAPGDAAPEAALRAGLWAVAGRLQSRHAELGRREAVVGGEAELRERELSKLRSWGDAAAEALIARDTARTRAEILAYAGVAVLDIAARRWIDGAADARLTAGVDEGLSTLALVPTKVPVEDG